MLQEINVYQNIKNVLLSSVIILAIGVGLAYYFDYPVKTIELMHGEIVGTYPKTGKYSGPIDVMVKSENGEVFESDLQGTDTTPILVNTYPNGTLVNITVFESKLFKRRKYQVSLESDSGFNPR